MVDMALYVGCCGFSIARSKYFKLFNVVELQETFYNPPDIGRLRALRSEAPQEFVFAMKCWQAVTHPLDSPTWRRAKVVPDRSLINRYGFLRPTREVFEAWELVAKAARELNARVVVVQTPPTFNYCEENYRNALEFFTTVDTSNFIVGWEPRGSWSNNPDKILDIVMRFKNVIHVVDVLKAKPVMTKEVSYFRLHGLGGDEVNYRYKYTDEDLMKLNNIIKDYLKGGKDVYVMFNNVYMTQDALRFKELTVKNI